jgi:hypothetical protein
MKEHVSEGRKFEERMRVLVEATTKGHVAQGPWPRVGRRVYVPREAPPRELDFPGGEFPNVEDVYYWAKD